MKKTFETYRNISDYQISNLKHENPSCFNGNIEITKYRVTIEEVEEPKEVLQARLQELWDKCNNWHHWKPLRAAARKLGYEFKNYPGIKKED
jgi:hypothetical protein